MYLSAKSDLGTQVDLEFCEVKVILILIKTM